ISKSFAMEVSGDGFKASAVNESNTIHVELIVPKKLLLYFRFNKISEDVDSVIASFASAELQSALPPSGKFITTLVMCHNDFKRMHYIRSVSSDRKNISNMSTITPLIRGNTSYSVGEIPDEPITKILVSELVSAISSIVKEGTPTTVFTMYKEGMRMHGVHSSGVEKGVSIFGNTDEEFEAENVESAKKLSERLKRIRGTDAFSSTSH